MALFGTLKSYSGHIFKAFLLKIVSMQGIYMVYSPSKGYLSSSKNTGVMGCFISNVADRTILQLQQGVEAATFKIEGSPWSCILMGCVENFAPIFMVVSYPRRPLFQF